MGNNKNKAVFLDRDGVINNTESFYYVFKTEDFIINEGAIEFIKYCNNNNYKVILISNQGGIAKDFYTMSDVEKVHHYLIDTLKNNGAMVDEIYFCPHHHETEKCICRKPDSQMIEKGIARFNIDKKRAIFLGDNHTDVLAGEKAGIKGIQIKANEDLRNYFNHLIK